LLPAPARSIAGLWRALMPLFVCVAVLGACRSGPPDRPGMMPYRVGEITLEGVTAFPEIEILDVLELQENRFNPFESARYFNRFAVGADIQRIETFYHMRGYFDARVVDHNVTFDDDRRRSRAEVRYVIEEGERSHFGRIVFDERDLRVDDVTRLVSRLGLPTDFEQASTLFDYTKVQAARETMRRRLQEDTYAYARVDARVYADRAARTASVYFFFDPGPSCLFGEVIVRGNRQIPAGMIRDRIRIQTGNAYRHALLRRSQIQLYDMDAFTYVSVEAQLDSDDEARLEAGVWSEETARRRLAFLERQALVDAEMADAGLILVAELRDEPRYAEVDVASFLDAVQSLDVVDPNVPVLITVSESPGATYRVGGGLGLQSGRTETYTRGRATWRNVIAPLNLVDFEARIGYAWLPTVFLSDRDIQGVIGRTTLGYRRPTALFNYFDLAMRVSYERNLRDDYAFEKPSATIGVERRLNDETRFQFSYTIDIVRTDDDFAETGSSCQAVPDRYRLTTLDLAIQTDHRDNPLHALRGYYGEMRVQMGLDGPVGQFPYLLMRPELRYYQPMGRRLSVAFRAQTSAIVDFGGNIPRSQCLYLGGGDTVRGFGERKLSPYETGVATGGLTSYVFNIEPRFEIGRNWLWGVVFLDAGSVSRGQFDYQFALGGEEGLHLATGGGFRLLTPIGPFRLDIGYRITGGPDYGDRVIQRMAFFISIGEAF